MLLSLDSFLILQIESIRIGKWEGVGEVWIVLTSWGAEGGLKQPFRLKQQ